MGMVGVLGVSACGGGGDESSGPYESSTTPGGAEPGSSESPTGESPTAADESPSAGESSSDGEVSTADVEFTEWELERRATPPPERPAEMSDPGEAGAIATAEYFVELMAFAEETGVIEDLAEISSGDCEYCRNYLNSAREGVLDGTYTSDTGLIILDTFAAAPRGDGTRAIVIDAQYSPRVTIDSNGERIGDREGLAFTEYVLLSWDDDVWSVIDASAETAGEG